MKLARWERFALEFSDPARGTGEHGLLVADVLARLGADSDSPIVQRAAQNAGKRYEQDRAQRVQPRSPQARYGRSMEDVTRIIAPGEQARALSDHHLDEVLEAIAMRRGGVSDERK